MITLLGTEILTLLGNALYYNIGKLLYDQVFQWTQRQKLSGMYYLISIYKAWHWNKGQKRKKKKNCKWDLSRPAKFFISCFVFYLFIIATGPYIYCILQVSRKLHHLYQLTNVTYLFTFTAFDTFILSDLQLVRLSE